MILRPATMADTDLLLRWRNDYETRRWSRNMELIDSAQHSIWLNRIVASKTQQLFIAEVDGEAVGTGRLDFYPDQVEVNLTIAPEKRGRGYGKALLKALVDQAAHSGRYDLFAYVKPGNFGSLILFMEHSDFFPADPQRFIVLKLKEREERF